MSLFSPLVRIGNGYRPKGARTYHVHDGIPTWTFVDAYGAGGTSGRTRHEEGRLRRWYKHRR